MTHQMIRRAKLLTIQPLPEVLGGSCLLQFCAGAGDRCQARSLQANHLTSYIGVGISRDAKMAGLCLYSWDPTSQDILMQTPACSSFTMAGEATYPLLTPFPNWSSSIVSTDILNRPACIRPPRIKIAMAASVRLELLCFHYKLEPSRNAE